MLKFDFTDKLTATLPNVPREHIIKFNNSWILDDEDAKLCHYIVVYRALVYKIDVDGHWEFANPAPKFPGQQGTPWCAGWAGPVGSAAAAGKIPEDRGGLYFDGVGVARISLKRSGVEPISSLENLQALEESIIIKSDQIILESDGLEDPRVFRWNGDYYLHTHSKLPSIARGQPAPEQPVYTGYSPNRRLMIEDEKNHTRKGLYVKITRLNEKNDNWSLDQSFFFGSNLSLNYEKNFGFFEERGILNAVYSVGHNGRPFTLFLGMLAGDKQVCQKFTRDMHLPTEEIQPNIKTNASPNTDSLKKIQNDYNKILLAPCLVMSNSAPLLENKGKGTWIGVGHARIDHESVQRMMDLFGLMACSVVQLDSRFKSLAMDKDAAYALLTNDHEFVSLVIAELR